MLLLVFLVSLLDISQVFSISDESKNFMIAPDDSANQNFAVLKFEELTQPTPHKLSLELRIYSQQTDDFKKCSLTLTTRWGAVKAGVSTFRRLIGDKVIFAWYDEMLDGSDRRTRIVTMNDNCHEINPVIDNLPSEPIILPSEAHSFNLIMNDEITCRAVGKRCRVSYNLKRGNAGQVWPLDVNLEWTTMKVNRLENRDFLVRGFEDTTYRILRVNHLTGANVTLLLQFEAKPAPEFVTSDMSVCGIVYPGFDKLVQCAEYNEENELKFQKRFTFEQPMTLVHMKNLGNGRLFLLAAKIECTDEFDCWKLYGLELKRGDKDGKLSFSHLHCTGERKELKVFNVSLAGDRIAVRYACKNDDEFSYNIGYFDADDSSAR